MTPIWESLHPQVTLNHLGLLPDMLDVDDPDSAKNQFDKNYQHGGGWHPIKGFKLVDGNLLYPGDPPMRPMAKTKLRNETIILFECAWVVIIQPDKTFEVCRMD